MLKVTESAAEIKDRSNHSNRQRASSSSRNPIPDPATEHLVKVHSIPIFPTISRGKRPRLKGSWKAIATCAPEAIEALFPPDEPRNIAAALPPGTIVIDPDDRGAPNGLAAWERLVAAHGLPDTVTALTGGGGKHVWCRIPDGLKVRGLLSANIQVKAHGGYVLLPPSVHSSGQRYRWAPGLSPLDVGIVPAPAWLLNLIAKPARQQQVRVRPAPGFTTTDAALGRILHDVRALALCTSGNRNEMANRVAFLAGVLSSRGDLDGDKAMRCVVAACHNNGLFADEPTKTADTLQRAFADGLAAGHRRSGGPRHG